ncbi:MAG: radical SAM protein [Desulfobacterales bacterium]|nr:radical SAM protein [Desulfobacterales bacterium]MBF0396966.1 radical SAM protein [Desulfobacterales bacterium]
MKGKPFIIPIFLPQAGCRHRCAFCNQSLTSGKNDNPLSFPKTIIDEVDRFLSFKKKEASDIQLAFYGGNFLGIYQDKINILLNEASNLAIQKKINSIRFSTRPDTIDNHRIELLKPFPVSTIELGVQSLDDNILNLINRGHTSHDTIRAVSILKENNYKVGLQIMVGLPGDNGTQSIKTAHIVADLLPDFVRIFPTIILSDTLLADWYKEGKYKPITLDESVEIVKNIYLIFQEKNIEVIRMGLQPSDLLKENIIAGPYHPAFGHMVLSKIFFEKAYNIINSKFRGINNIIIQVAPKNISNMRGQKNSNINLLKKQFDICTIEVVPISSLSENEIFIHS